MSRLTLLTETLRQKTIDLLAERGMGASSYVNNEYFPKVYLREVQGDIRVLKWGMDLMRMERDEEGLFQHILQKYTGAYCPSAFYRQFSSRTQLQYLLLRVEIDDVLARKNQFFSDQGPAMAGD